MAKILIVDDEPQVAAALGRVLRRRGFVVELCESGREALARLEGAPFDLLITDVVMPEMSGTSLAAEVRRRWPEIQCLLLSGYASLDHAPFEGEPLAVMRKPWGAEELVSTIEQALEAARVSR